jgi:DNA-binding XRE family transcriptional regulator
MVHFFKIKTEKCNYLFSVLVFLLAAQLCFSCMPMKKAIAVKEVSHVGVQIKNKRISMGYSIDELAKAVRMSKENLELIEKGMATPIYYKLIAIQEFLGAEFVMSLN